MPVLYQIWTGKALAEIPENDGAEEGRGELGFHHRRKQADFLVYLENDLAGPARLRKVEDMLDFGG